MARPTQPQRLRVVGYVRVSTAKQADEGVSLAAQRERLAAYCKLYDHELLTVEADEGASAKTLERPALRAALARIERGEADALLVLKLDRLTRSVRDLGELLETHFATGRGVLLSVQDSIDTSTAAGRLMLNLLVSVAQWEREAIGERTKTALAQVKSEGGRLGALPYGERRDVEQRDDAGRLLVLPEDREAQAAAVARSLWASGASFAAIGSELSRQGYAPRSGGAWAPSTLAGMVRRPAAPERPREALSGLEGLEVPFAVHAPSGNGGGKLRARIAAKTSAKSALREALTAWRAPPALPLARVELLLWRGSRSKAWDADNAAARAKPLRDVVARWLGCDDREGSGVDEWPARSVWRGGALGVTVVLAPRVRP